MKSYLKAETLKLRHTSIRRMTLLLPLFTILLSATLNLYYTNYLAYNWWCISLNPILTTLVAIMITAKDQQLSERAVKLLPIDLKKVWYSKIIYGAVLSVGASLILALVCSLINYLLGNQSGFLAMETSRMLVGGLIIGLLTTWQIPFSMICYRKLGFVLTILVNVGMSGIVGGEMATKNLWYLFPHSYSLRLSVPVLHLLPNGLQAIEGNPTYSDALMKWTSIPIGLVISICLLVVFSYLGAIYFAKSEAK